MEKRELLRLNRFANEIRLATIEELIELGFGHIGGSMSICELLAVLYGKHLKYDINNVSWPDRDYLICSKGHSGPALYAALALSGFMSPDVLKTLNKPGTSLPSHCDRNLTKGIDMTTGSLGQGLSVGVGVALANKIDKRHNFVYVIVGDGEAQEGQIWEAVMTANHYNLSNLIVFIDSNEYQINGSIKSINDISNFRERFIAFGWNSIEINGHDIDSIDQSIYFGKSSEKKPTAVIMHTIKGYGCKYALEQARCHSLKMPSEKLEESIAVIKRNIEDIDFRLAEETFNE